jgi:hypothetical protein
MTAVSLEACPACLEKDHERRQGMNNAGQALAPFGCLAVRRERSVHLGSEAMR